jgi:hypothetical protein
MSAPEDNRPEELDYDNPAEEANDEIQGRLVIDDSENQAEVVTSLPVQREPSPVAGGGPGTEMAKEEELAQLENLKRMAEYRIPKTQEETRRKILWSSPLDCYRRAPSPPMRKRLISPLRDPGWEREKEERRRAFGRVFNPRRTESELRPRERRSRDNSPVGRTTEPSQRKGPAQERESRRVDRSAHQIRSNERQSPPFPLERMMTIGTGELGRAMLHHLDLRSRVRLSRALCGRVDCEVNKNGALLDLADTDIRLNRLRNLPYGYEESLLNMELEEGRTRNEDPLGNDDEDECMVFIPNERIKPKPKYSKREENRLRREAREKDKRRKEEIEYLRKKMMKLRKLLREGLGPPAQSLRDTGKWTLQELQREERRVLGDERATHVQCLDEINKVIQDQELALVAARRQWERQRNGQPTASSRERDQRRTNSDGHNLINYWKEMDRWERRKQKEEEVLEKLQRKDAHRCRDRDRTKDRARRESSPTRRRGSRSRSREGKRSVERTHTTSARHRGMTEEERRQRRDRMRDNPPPMVGWLQRETQKALDTYNKTKGNTYANDTKWYAGFNGGSRKQARSRDKSPKERREAARELGHRLEVIQLEDKGDEAMDTATAERPQMDAATPAAQGERLSPEQQQQEEDAFSAFDLPTAVCTHLGCVTGSVADVLGPEIGEVGAAPIYHLSRILLLSALWQRNQVLDPGMVRLILHAPWTEIMERMAAPRFRNQLLPIKDSTYDWAALEWSRKCRVAAQQVTSGERPWLPSFRRSSTNPYEQEILSRFAEAVARLRATQVVPETDPQTVRTRTVVICREEDATLLKNLRLGGVMIMVGNQLWPSGPFILAPTNTRVIIHLGDHHPYRYWSDVINNHNNPGRRYIFVNARHPVEGGEAVQLADLAALLLYLARLQ